MNLHQFLLDHANEITDEAMRAMDRAHLKHYEEAGKEHIHARLKALCVLCTRGVKERNLGPMIAHADEIARERFSAGYDLWEVQTAFNDLLEDIECRLYTIAPVVSCSASSCQR